MCGRYTLIKLAEFTDLFPWVRPFGGPLPIPPRYNIAPSQPVAVVTNEGKNQIDFFRWGLVPSWAKDISIGSRMINARSETLASKRTFHTALKRRRCLIPADGFYEWKPDRGAKTKTPMYIRMKSGKPFAFAGLWDIWQSADGSELPTCTIITGEPNELVRPIHNRMPIILEPENYRKWIVPGEHDAEEFDGLLRTYPADQMQASPVGRIVNNPAADVPQCIEPATPESSAPPKRPGRKKQQDDAPGLFD